MSSITPDQENNWKKAAADSGLPVFPIKIARRGGKWDKQPLVRNWQNDASYDVNRFDWAHANGYGVLMGERAGLYALDFDDYKEGASGDQWLAKHKVPVKTRTHRTISGGLHRIYALLGKYKTLPTRANIVQGLDSRGQGGFIAFGEGYEMVDDRFPTILPEAACEDIIEGYGGSGGAVVLKSYVAPNNVEQLEAKLQRALMMRSTLKHRWLGGNLGLADKSGSAMDHSVAKLLSLAGFAEEEIVWVLLNRFEHGSARAKGDIRVAVRAAGRSAAKSIVSTEEEQKMTTGWQEPKQLDESQQEMLNAILEGRK